MADETKKVVLDYQANVSSLLRSLSSVEKANQRMTNTMGKNAVKAEKLLGNMGSSIKNTAPVYDKVSGKVTKLGSSVATASTKIKTANGIVGTYTENIKRMSDGTQRVSGSFKQATTATEGFVAGIGRLLKRAVGTVLVWTALRTGMQLFNRAMKSSVKFLIEWEYQLAQVAIVGNTTTEQLSALSGALIQVGKDFGVSYKDLGEASKLWRQQGRAMEEIIPLMRTTAKLSLLTGQTTSESVENLTAVLKAYRIEAKDSINIIDSMTNVMLCFDSETELLTDSGWKKHNEISYDNKVLSLNLESNKATYEEIDNIFKDEHYFGPMISYDHNINFMVTPSHKFPMASNNSMFYKTKKYELRDIKHAVNNFNIPSSCTCIGEDLEYYTIPSYKQRWINPRNKKTYFKNWAELSYKTTDLVEFMGWFVSEGSFIGRTICISQHESVHPEEVAQIKHLLKRMNLDYRYNGKDFCIRGRLRQFKIWLKKESYVPNARKHCYTKRIPDFIKGLSKKYLQLFLDSYIKGDGYEHPDHSPVGYTCSKTLKDDLMEIAVKIGTTPSCKKYNNVYRIIFSSKTHHVLRKKEFVNSFYKGLIWSVETNPNHTIYARRNGTCYWSGNSHAITAGDLSSAYKQVASTASSLGVSFSELSGYITAIKAVTRDSGSKIGLSLRTMFSRITTSSAEAIQKISSVPLYLNNMGQATYAVTPTMRALGSIISELSLKFGSLGTAQKSQLASLIGGVRRQNQVFALFDNFTESVEAQTDALFGLGKSSDAINILTDTAKVGIDKLKNSWYSFVESIGNSDAIKSFINALAGAINGLDKALAPNKARYKASLDLLNDQNDAYARQIQLADGVGQVLVKVQQAKEQSTRLSKEQNAILTEQVKIMTDGVNQALRAEGISTTIAEGLGLDDVITSLEELDNKMRDLKVDALVGQEIKKINTELLSAGQSISAFKKDFDAVAKTGLRTKKIEGLKESIDSLKKIAKGIKLSDDEANNLVSTYKKLNKYNVFFGKLVNKTGEDIAKQEILLEGLVEGYIDGNTALSDRDKIKADILQKIEDEVKSEENLAIIKDKQDTINKAILADQLERLKNAGVLNSEILIQKKALQEQLGIEESLASKINDQLSLERELTKEKRLQGGLDSESVKVFEVAKEYGNKVAKQINDVLSGKISFDDFEKKGGKALEVFKKDFSTKYTQQQAQQFYSGKSVANQKNIGSGENFDIGEKNREKVKRGQEDSLSDYDKYWTARLDKRKIADKAMLNQARLFKQENARIRIQENRNATPQASAIPGVPLGQQTPIPGLQPQTVIPAQKPQTQINAPVKVDINTVFNVNDASEIERAVMKEWSRQAQVVGSAVYKGLTNFNFGKQVINN